MKYLVIIIIFLSLVACNKTSAPDCIKTKGNVIESTRELDNFNRVILRDMIDLKVIQDQSNFLKIRAGENIIPKIVTKVENNELLIEDNNRCNFIRDLEERITIELHTSGFRDLEVYGSGDISFKNPMIVPVFNMDAFETNAKHDINVQTDSCKIKYHIGGNDLILEGTSNYLFLFNLGNNWMRAEGLTSSLTHISSDSSGDVFVNVQNTLLYEIHQTGNIYYQGIPDTIITLEHSGSGNIISL